MENKKLKQLEKVKADIEAQIEAEKNKGFKLNEWYVQEGADSIFYALVENGFGLKGYGFNSDGWCDSNTWSTAPQWNVREATPQEVEAALTKEAEKRGFKEGVKFQSISSSTEMIWLTSFNLTYNSKHNVLFNNDYGKIFNNGIWAKIIEEPKVVINGYEMKQEKDIISFGCAKIHKNRFKEWYQYCYMVVCGDGSNREISSIKLDSGVEISVGQLKEIVYNIK
jgi:hypothetical protein